MEYHADYALHTLLYLTRMASHGDYETPRQLGVKQQQMERILALNTQELHDMARMSRTPLMSITFDTDALDAVLEACGKHVQQRDLMFRLIDAGASHPVMNALFGLTRSDMTDYRKYRNITDGNGRPAIPSDEEKNTIWHVWKQQLHDNQNLGLAEQLLAIYQQTGVKISAIWPLVMEWMALEKQHNK